jgi:hypothetical protein
MRLVVILNDLLLLIISILVEMDGLGPETFRIIGLYAYSKGHGSDSLFSPLPLASYWFRA